MFALTVAPEFEAWFQALEASAAEHVAAALDLLEVSGPDLDGVEASRLLLWYDGMRQLRLAPAMGVADLGKATDELRRLSHWHQEAIRWLDSPSFLARLAELEPATAKAALLAIERVRERIRVTRSWGPHLTGIFPNLPGAAVPAVPLAGRAEFIAQDRIEAGQGPASQNSVKSALRELLSVMGLDIKDAPAPPSGLRELVITSTVPQLRVIVGIDVRTRQILALLGEPLDRAYYGDSVRQCEQRWREFCASTALVAETD